jgi:hypothetical protein
MEIICVEFYCTEHSYITVLIRTQYVHNKKKNKFNKNLIFYLPIKLVYIFLAQRVKKI